MFVFSCVVRYYLCIIVLYCVLRYSLGIKFLWISLSFLCTIIYEVLYTWCLKYNIWNTWFLDTYRNVNLFFVPQLVNCVMKVAQYQYVVERYLLYKWAWHAVGECIVAIKFKTAKLDFSN